MPVVVVVLLLLSVFLCLPRCIGGGAFGEVYVAKWHGTEVAVKCLAPSLLAPSNASSGSSSTPGHKAAADLMREAAMLAKMHHPNIVSVYGVVLPPRDMVSLSVSTGMDWEEAYGSSSGAFAGASARHGGHVSGPALVCEYMAAGSLQSAIHSGADWLKSGMAKTKVMLDTARVSVQLATGAAVNAGFLQCIQRHCTVALQEAVP